MYHKKAIALFICSILWLVAQCQNVTLPSVLQDTIDEYLSKNISLSLSDHHYDERMGISYYYFQHQYDGFPIFGYISTASMCDGSDHVFFTAQIADFKVGPKKDKIRVQTSDKDAIQIALSDFNIQSDLSKLRKQKSNSAQRQYALNKTSSESILVDEVFVVLNGELHLAKQVATYIDQIDQWWQIRIDDSTGKIIDKNSWTVECSYDNILHGVSDHSIHTAVISDEAACSLAGPDSSYLVFGSNYFSPNDGTRTTEVRPWSTNAPMIGSPYGWHDDNGIKGAEYTITRGNNAYAYPDRNADGNPDTDGIPNGGTNLSFHYCLDPNDDPIDYREAATTNLFYWNNVAHDVLYNYGFDESSGNFQANNYGKGGIQGDFVKAEAQDGSGVNNANFSTPPDGFSPRMQMYEWTQSNNSSFIINGVNSYSVSGASFGPSIASISAALIQTNPTEGCATISNSAALNGKVALIDRGNCLFIEKTLEAQIAGAVAVVICNTENSTFTMGGTSASSINIPAVMLAKNNCDSIKVLLDNNSPVNLSLNISSSPNRDSDLDNGVIIHEYGHGVSIRLTGGASNTSCLSNAEQMGEGWSDYFGLIMTIKSGDTDVQPRGMATYLLGENNAGAGIRNYPYTTDMNINPFTYDDIKQVSVPHGVGSVWATMLWDMTWSLIDKYGYNPDIYSSTGGNNKALQLVMTALKIQPCNPGFVDGRNAILMADEMLYAGTNKCLIWEAFARRGLGYSADQGSSGDRGDGIEAFDLPPSCDNKLSIIKSTTSMFVENGDTIPYMLSIINNFPTQLTNVVVSDLLSDQLTYVDGTQNIGTESGGEVSYSSATLDSGTQISIEFKTIVNSDLEVRVDHIENFEEDLSWTINALEGGQSWQVTSTNPHSGNNALFIENVSSIQTHELIKDVYLPQEALFSFWHKFNTETKWDGGFVEISTDDGSTWIDLSSRFLKNGYTHQLINSSNPVIAGKRAFSGNSNGYIQSIIDLSDYANQDVLIRFVFGSDTYVSVEGWYIDDITIFQSEAIVNKVYITSSNHPTLSSSVKSYRLPNCEECAVEYSCISYNSTVSSFEKETYWSNSSISSDGQLGDNDALILKAQQSIELLPNFSIGANSIFIAEIADCVSGN